ncbi:MAG: hypothetical protein ACOC8X_07300, partial [Chloroflexota bacterium]
MTNVKTTQHGRSLSAFLFLTLFCAILILAHAISTAGAASPASDAALDDGEPRALLMGLRADRLPRDAIQRDTAQLSSALDPTGEIQEMQALFPARDTDKQNRVYHDPQLDVPLSLDHIYRLDLAPGASAEETMARLQQRPEVAFVEPDYVAHQLATPNDPEYG